MANIVKLYVYDLSNGLARQLSRQLTGKQIDGIWFVIKYLIVAFFLIIYGSPGIPRSWCSEKVCSSQSLDIMYSNIYDTEIFYGQGIHTTSPGMSHVRLFDFAILGLCSYLC
jgi:hypothetical protein